MQDQPSATILAFPKPAAPPVLEHRVAGPGAEATQYAQARLRNALASLDAALAAQRTALAEWRGALSDLRSSVRGLGESLGSCHSALGVLGEQVSSLNAEARRLEQTADQVLGTHAGA